MRTILRKIIFYSVTLFLATQFLEGIKIHGGLLTYILGSIVLTILFFTIKPILNLITLPLNILTLGLFSFITNAAILYLLTIFVPNISITAFRLNGFSFLGFVVPSITVNTFFAFVVVSIFLSFVEGLLKWLTKK